MLQYKVNGAAGREARIAPRHKVFEPTTMRIGAIETRVHLINLSTSGALVHAAAPPEHGMPVRLLVGGLWRGARVAWVAGRRFGVAFAAPLHDRDLAPLLAALAVERTAATG